MLGEPRPRRGRSMLGVVACVLVSGGRGWRGRGAVRGARGASRPLESAGAPRPRRGPSMLGVVAYVLVPGERRRRATGHFRRAGFEVLRGVGELARPDRPSAEGAAGRGGGD